MTIIYSGTSSRGRKPEMGFSWLTSSAGRTHALGRGESRSLPLPAPGGRLSPRRPWPGAASSIRRGQHRGLCFSRDIAFSWLSDPLRLPRRTRNPICRVVFATEEDVLGFQWGGVAYLWCQYLAYHIRECEWLKLTRLTSVLLKNI